MRVWRKTAIAMLATMLIACSNDPQDRTDQQRSSSSNAIHAVESSSNRKVPAPGDSSEEEDAAIIDQDRIDRLRSLPYAQTVEPTPIRKTEDPAIDSGTKLSTRETDGYTLATSAGPALAMLIDGAGKIVHTWRGEEKRTWIRAELIEGGDLLVLGVNRGTKAHRDQADQHISRIDWSGNVKWIRMLPVHHDVSNVVDDTFISLTFRFRRAPSLGNFIVRDDDLTFMKLDGSLVRKSSLMDILGARSNLFSFQDVAPKGEPRPHVDLLHANTVEWISHEHLVGRDPIYGPDTLIVTMRHQDSIVIIHWRKQELLWAWGQGEVMGPHDAQVLENGHILIFDNGLGRDWSRVIEVDPLRREIVWQYEGSPRDSFYSASRGACQRLESGRTLITDSTRGRIFEVDPEGKIVWEFFNPYFDPLGKRFVIPRAKRIPKEMVEPFLAPDKDRS